MFLSVLKKKGKKNKGKERTLSLSLTWAVNHFLWFISVAFSYHFNHAIPFMRSRVPFRFYRSSKAKRFSPRRTFIPIITGVPLKTTVYGSRDKGKNYQLALRCHRDRKRQVEPGSVHRDKPLRVGITVRRGKQKRVASGGRVALAVATTRPSLRSPADLWSCHRPTSKRRCTVAWRRPPRRSAVTPPAFRKPAPTFPSRRTRSLQVYLTFRMPSIRVSYSVFAKRALIT